MVIDPAKIQELRDQKKSYKDIYNNGNNEWGIEISDLVTHAKAKNETEEAVQSLKGVDSAHKTKLVKAGFDLKELADGGMSAADLIRNEDFNSKDILALMDASGRPKFTYSDLYYNGNNGRPLPDLAIVAKGLGNDQQVEAVKSLKANPYVDKAKLVNAGFDLQALAEGGVSAADLVKNENFESKDILGLIGTNGSPKFTYSELYVNGTSGRPLFNLVAAAKQKDIDGNDQQVEAVKSLKANPHVDKAKLVNAGFDLQALAEGGVSAADLVKNENFESKDILGLIGTNGSPKFTYSELHVNGTSGRPLFNLVAAAKQKDIDGNDQQVEAVKSLNANPHVDKAKLVNAGFDLQALAEGGVSAADLVKNENFESKDILGLIGTNGSPKFTYSELHVNGTSGRPLFNLVAAAKQKDIDGNDQQVEAVKSLKANPYVDKAKLVNAGFDLQALAEGGVSAADLVKNENFESKDILGLIGTNGSPKFTYSELYVNGTSGRPLFNLVAAAKQKDIDGNDQQVEAVKSLKANPHVDKAKLVNAGFDLQALAEGGVSAADLVKNENFESKDILGLIGTNGSPKFTYSELHVNGTSGRPLFNLVAAAKQKDIDGNDQQVEAVKSLNANPHVDKAKLVNAGFDLQALAEGGVSAADLVKNENFESKDILGLIGTNGSPKFTYSELHVNGTSGRPLFNLVAAAKQKDIDGNDQQVEAVKSLKANPYVDKAKLVNAGFDLQALAEGGVSAADLVKNENFESKDILGLIGTNGSPKFTYSELYVNGTSGRALSDLVAAAIERREEAIAINSLYSSPHLSNTKLGNAGFQADNFYQAGLPGLFKSLPEQANRFHIDAATYKRELKGLSYKAIYEEGQNPLINDTGSHQWLSAIIKTAQRRNEEIEAIKDLQNLSNELLSTSDIVQFGEGSDNYYSFSLSALASAGISIQELIKNKDFSNKELLSIKDTDGVTAKFTYKDLYNNGYGRDLAGLVATALTNNQAEAAINSLKSVEHKYLGEADLVKYGEGDSSINGFTANDLAQAGIAASVLVQNKDFSNKELLSIKDTDGVTAKFTYKDLYNRGYGRDLAGLVATALANNQAEAAINSLKSVEHKYLGEADLVKYGEGDSSINGFTANDLAQAGIAASVLVQNKDFSNKELLSIKDTDGVAAKFTYKDLYNRGYGRDLAGLVATALANNQAEAAINSLKSVEHKYLGEADLVKYGEGDSSINGFTANDLAQAGIAASVLVQNKDFSNKELLSIKDTDGVTAKFTYKDLYNRGYGRDLAGLVATALANNQAEAAINSLKSVEHKYLGEADLVKYGEGDSSINGFTANDLAQAGIAASVLVQNKDFSNKELLSIKDTDGVAAKFTYKDLYNNGYGRDLAGLVATALTNNQAEVAINSLKSVEHKYLGEADLVKYGEGDSSINGFTANDLAQAGIAASVLVQNKDFSNEELLSIKDTDGVTAKFTYKDLYNRGYGRDLAELVTTSKARKEQIDAIDSLKSVNSKYLGNSKIAKSGFNASDLKTAGISASDVIDNSDFTSSELVGAGYTYKELFDNSSGRRLDDLITTSKARGEMDIAIDQLSTVQGKYLTQGELIYALPSASVMAVGGVTQDTFVNSLGYTEAEAKGFIATAKALTDNILLAAEGVTNELGPEKSLEFTYELRDAKVVPSATSTTFLDYKDKSQTALTSVAVRGDSIDSTSKYLLDIKVKNLEEDYDLESTDITIKYDKDLFDQIDQSQIRIGDAMPIANAVHIDNDNGEIRIAAGSINKLGKGKKIDHLGETTLATIAFNFNETNLEKHSTTNPGKKLFYSPPAEGDNLINEFKGNLSFSLEVNKDSTIFSKVDEAANNSTIKTLRDLAVDSAHVGGDFEVTGKPISLYEASMELSQDNQLYFGSERIIGVSSNSLKTNLIRAGDTVKTDISWKNTGNCHADDIKIESVGSNSLATLVEELSSISSTHLCGGEFDDSGQYVANDKSIDVSLAVRIESDSAGKVFDSSQHFYKLSVGSQSFDQGKGTKNLITFQGDLNYDGNVGMKDLAFLNAGARRQKIETGQTVASDTTYARDVDANFDGLISINDLSILDKDWGKTMHLGDNDFHGQGTATNQITWNELSSQNIEGTSSNQAHTWQNDSFEKQNSLESKAKSDGYDTPLGYRVINENSNPAPTVSDSNQDPDVVTYSDSALTTGLGSTSGDGDIQGTSLQDDIIGGSSIG